MSGILDIGFSAIVIVVALLTIGFILARLYRRASKEISFVRTGFRGERVIMNGGALVFPVLHETIPVNMNTLRLEVRRDQDQGLITQDRMRVDVVAEFYVRVQPNREAIASAAQTLGQRTMVPEQLKELVEGKFVDALRAVAAEMTMEELHEKRIDFVQKVQQAVTEDLLKNGLELESVSLTGLDQTAKDFFNPNNAFDAEGLTRLTQAIEERRKIRNDIEQDTKVQIENKNLEADKLSFEIGRQQEYARLEQEREIESQRAAQEADIARERAERSRESQEAEIQAKREVESAQILADKEVEQKRIEKERMIRQTEIDKERAVETDVIEKRKTVELAEQVRAIVIAEKSREQSEAQAAADAARALAVRAEEQVTTVRETEKAERDKGIELIKADEEAQREAIKVKVQASAEKAAAADQADALREEAQGQSDKARIAAEGEAAAERALAEAREVTYAVEATGTRAVNEAKNVLSVDLIQKEIKEKLIDNLDQIIREAVKPIEKIDGIRIVQVDGLTNGSGPESNGEAGGGGGSLVDSAVNSALRYRAQAPVLDALLKEVGLNGDTINGLTKPLAEEVAGPSQK